MTTYHWIMTVRFTGGTNGDVEETFDGILSPDAPTTRQKCLKPIKDMIKAELGVTKLAVLYFSVEPNDLSTRTASSGAGTGFLTGGVL